MILLPASFSAIQRQGVAFCPVAEGDAMPLSLGVIYPPHQAESVQDHAFPARNTRQQHIMLGRLFHIRRGIASPVENAARVVKETRITLAFKPEQRPMIERA